MTKLQYQHDVDMVQTNSLAMYMEGVIVPFIRSWYMSSDLLNDGIYVAQVSWNHRLTIALLFNKTWGFNFWKFEWYLYENKNMKHNTEQLHAS